MDTRSIIVAGGRHDEGVRDGNILAFSPDGLVLFVADRLAGRVVFMEAAVE